MNRTELERLDRDSLIARAEANGVVRARILTRPELIDELIQRASQPGEVARARGLFGRARDLLARVIERGLHLPDAAERLRSRSSSPPPPVRPGAPLPTVTLAEIYAAQGHRDRAVETLKDVLEREPDHAAARKLIERLEDSSYEPPKRPSLPPEDEIFSPSKTMPRARAVATVEDDECVAIPIDRETLFVQWRVSERTRAHFEESRPGGALVLRVVVISPAWNGPESSVRDVHGPGAQGDLVLRELPPGAVVRAAIGWRVGEDLVGRAVDAARGDADRGAGPRRGGDRAGVRGDPGALGSSAAGERGNAGRVEVGSRGHREEDEARASPRALLVIRAPIRAM
jgi:hypothetical protein